MSDQSLKWNPILYQDKHQFVSNYGMSLIDLLQPKENERILDLGCGTGELTNQISTFGADVIGIDYSHEMVEQAKKNFPELVFQQMDGHSLIFDQKFDAVFSNAALHWMKQPKQVIQSVYSVLKPSGRFVLEMGGKGNVNQIVTTLVKTLTEMGFSKQAKNNPWYFPSIGEYTSLLENEGFSVHFAQCFERPTKLANLETGIMDWLEMFGNTFFEGLSINEKLSICQSVQDQLKDVLVTDGSWYADYKRLRIEAIK